MIFKSFFLQSSKENEIPMELLKKIDDELAVGIAINAQYFDTFLMKYPKSDYLIGMKAYYLFYRESPVSAKDYLEKNIRENQLLNSGTFTKMVLGLLQNNDSKEFELLESLKLDNHLINKWVRFELFCLYEDREDHLKALKYLSLALSIDPFFTNTLIEKANIAIDNGDIIHAKTIIDTLIEKHPQYPVAYMYKAKFAIEDQKFADAIKNYSIILKSDSTNIDALIGIGYVNQYNLNNLEEAKKYYELALDYNKTNPATLKRLGILMSDMEDYENAIKYLVESSSLIDDYETYTELIYVYIKKLDIAAASTVFDKSIIKYGHDMRIDFFDILLTYFKNEKKVPLDKLDEFYSAYSREDFMWLKNQLSYWKIEIVERNK